MPFQHFDDLELPSAEWLRNYDKEEREKKHKLILGFIKYLGEQNVDIAHIDTFYHEKYEYDEDPDEENDVSRLSDLEIDLMIVRFLDSLDKKEQKKRARRK